MRKRITSKPQRESPSANTSWLDLEALARVEVTSEDAAHPIESALLTVGAIGSRAESPGEQTVRLLFDLTQLIAEVLRCSSVDDMEDHRVRNRCREPSHPVRSDCILRRPPPISDNH